MNLTDYVKQVSLEDFGKPFKHKAQWNTRLRSTGGRFFSKDGHLDFNPKVYQELGLEVFRKIVRHELCHYHLYFEGRGYQHKDLAFKQLLKEVDGLRFVPPLSSANKKPNLVYTCQSCQQIYQRKRKIDTKRYRCGLCRGKLLLLNRPKD
ncbi:SprT family protein [Streptococcus timonensis]|uniref:SprT family protein n=1 Tax=Streptococcus timonensis TaxID=1852387 RepID=UPI0039C25A4E